MSHGQEKDKRLLLVIEDDPGLQKQIKWGLEQYDLVFATDRESAIAQLRRHEPDVITLDLGLPRRGAVVILGSFEEHAESTSREARVGGLGRQCTAKLLVARPICAGDVESCKVPSHSFNQVGGGCRRVCRDDVGDDAAKVAT